ncbi:hypothetical protein [Streptomyces sp. x-45]|uniref:hypothetical protein n=1 Tax=Streptomyces sp. x-45 TaxID=2789281 RepID=UPI003980DB3F
MAHPARRTCSTAGRSCAGAHNPTETQVSFVLRERSVKGVRGAESFYSQEVVQVRTDTWSRGRVALVGAYVLAGELNRHGHDLPTALARYDSVLRPFVNEIQAEVEPHLLRLGMPGNPRAIDAFHAVTALACRLRDPEFVARHAKEDRGGARRLPDMPVSCHRDVP